MKPTLRTCLLCYALATCSAWIRADSDGSETAATELVRRPVIDEVKLADMRGGLSIAGLDYTIGAVMRTRVDGSVVLESAIDLDSISGKEVANSIVLNDSKGITEISHDLSKDRIVATVVNQANHRDIQVEVDINVTVQNFQSLQAASIRNRIMDSLSGIISR